MIVYVSFHCCLLNSITFALQAIEVLKRALANHPESGLQAELHFEMGNHYKDIGSHQDAFQVSPGSLPLFLLGELVSPA